MPDALDLPPPTAYVAPHRTTIPLNSSAIMFGLDAALILLA